MGLGAPLVLLASLDLALQWGLWAAASALRTEKFFDLAVFLPNRAFHADQRQKACLQDFFNSTGSGTFILLAHLSLRWGYTQHPRQQVQTGLVTIWGLRLGLFLFLRILKEGHDRRFNGIRENPTTFFFYWTMQGTWVFITLLPTLILNLEKHQVPLGFLDYLGWFTWAVGFIIEAVADQQKWQFRSNPDNTVSQGGEVLSYLAVGIKDAILSIECCFDIMLGWMRENSLRLNPDMAEVLQGRFIQSGLWAYSRHPNYLGEILLWTGLFLSALSVLHGWQYIGIVSPLLVWFLLSYVSGIPVLERAAMKRWGKEAAFQDYLQKTPVLWPVLGKR